MTRVGSVTATLSRVLSVAAHAPVTCPWRCGTDRDGIGRCVRARSKVAIVRPTEAVVPSCS